MKVKVQGSELSRVGKILSGIVNPKDSKLGNIRISGDADGLTFFATNGSISATMKIPVLGLDDETFCVDGTMFGRIVQGAGKEVEISTDGKACSIRTSGRTRIPIVSTEIIDADDVTGETFTIGADALSAAVDGVAHAVATDESRLVLTGILIETEVDTVRFVAIDGFQMAIEEMNFPCPEGIRMIVPGVHMRKICSSISSGEEVLITTDGKRASFRTDSIEMTCALLSGEFVDYKRILPTSFQTSVRLRADDLKTVIVAGRVATARNNLVRVEVGDNEIIIRSQNEQAEFEARVPCETQGSALKTAYNEKYLFSALNSVRTEYVTMNFNRPTDPEVMKADGFDGIRLTLPVRVAG